jgi:hypothetical protein
LLIEGKLTSADQRGTMKFLQRGVFAMPLRRGEVRGFDFNRMIVEHFPFEMRIMTDKQREIAETVLARNQRRETEINDALKQEYARRSVCVSWEGRVTVRLSPRE